MASCDIFVIVPPHWYLARPCIDAILRRTESADFRLCLVDISFDPFVAAEIERYVRMHGNIVAIDAPANVTLHRAIVNDCLKRTTADFAVFVSVDTIVSTGWLPRLLDALGRDETAAFASPALHSADLAELPMTPGTDLERMARLVSHEQAIEMPWPEPACFALKHECLAQLGYLDELFESFEIALQDFGHRGRRFGYRTVCVPSAYFYRRGDFDVDDGLPESTHKHDAMLLTRRWGETSTAEKLLHALASKLRQFRPCDFLPKPGEVRAKLLTSDSLEILCILPTMNPYGGVISVVNLMNDLMLRGHHCTMVSLSKCDEHPHIFYAAPDFVRDWDEIPERYAGEYDIVLATSWETVAYARAIAEKSERAHCMYFIQDMEARFYDIGDPRQQKALDTYPEIETKFAKTAYLREEMKELGHQIHQIHPGMNLDLFYPRTRESRQERTVLGMVRYGHHHRGYDLILEVFEEIARRYPNLRIVLFGTDNLKEADISFAYENAGRVTPQQLPELYSQADIFLEMSRHHGFGRTGLEAMACGAACVLSDSGGLAEYARDEENALIVPVEDVDAAIQGVIRILEDDILRCNLVDNGFLTASRYNESLATQDFLNIVYKTHPGLGAISG